MIAAYAQQRRGELSDAEMRERLTAIRQDIAALSLSPAHRSELIAAMREEFGERDDYGLFLRSDTNVEDLPQFTGAGLSETVPNVTGLERQLQTIPRVWASVLSPRAVAWRSDLLTNPAEVYASVLLMRSVPSEKSGVLVTSDLSGLGQGLTVSTGWGVGGAVAGEAVETVVLRPGGAETLISEAKTAYQRQLTPAGGMRWQPAPSGPVLNDEDKAQLRRLAGAAETARGLGLAVHAGHGLTYENVTPVAAIPELEELNIGHSIVSRAVLTGMESAVREMADILRRARSR